MRYSDFQPTDADVLANMAAESPPTTREEAGSAAQDQDVASIRHALNLIIVTDRMHPVWKDAETALDALDRIEKRLGWPE